MCEVGRGWGGISRGLGLDGLRFADWSILSYTTLWILRAVYVLAAMGGGMAPEFRYEVVDDS